MLPPNPFAPLRRKHRMRLWFVVVALSLATMGGLYVTGHPMITPAAPRGVMSYEFAWTTPNATAMVHSWNPDARLMAAINLGLDYLCMPLYAVTIALAVDWAARRRAGRWHSLGQWLLWLPFFAAVFDAIENYGLIQLLRGAQQSHWAPMASWCATIKFALVGLGAIYFAAGTAMRVGGIGPPESDD